MLSVKGCGLPEERGELASARDRDDAGWLAAVAVQVLPAGVEALLGAPGDLDHARVLTGLAASERRRRSGAGGGSGGRPRPAAGGRGRAGLGDRSLAALGVRGALGRHDPEKPGEQRRPGEAARSRRPRRTRRRRRACRSRGSSAAGRSPAAWLALGDLLLERADQRLAATEQQLDRGEVVDERSPASRRPRSSQRAQPAPCAWPSTRRPVPGSARPGAAGTSRAGGGRASDRRGRPRSQRTRSRKLLILDASARTRSAARPPPAAAPAGSRRAGRS